MQDTCTNLDGDVDAYDLLVVYTPRKARSANKCHMDAPFSKKSNGYNDTYSYFLMKCRESGIKAAFATSNDIIGPGLVQGFWTYGKKWKKNLHKAYSGTIFDKFRDSKKRKLLSFKSVYIFNRKTARFFSDKLRTYNLFREFSVPTASINSISKKGLLLAKRRLDRLSRKRGISSREYLIKDRFGSQGYGIFKTDLNPGSLNNLLAQLRMFTRSDRPASYILQPFINCDNGFAIGKHSGFIDLRIIILNRRIVETYIRIARKGDFRNDGMNGGRLVFIPRKSVPGDVARMANRIRGIIDKECPKNHFYALDFIRSNDGKTFLVEGNSKPGITWAFGQNSPDMTEADKLINRERNMRQIDLIVKTLKSAISRRRQEPAA